MLTKTTLSEQPDTPFPIISWARNEILQFAQLIPPNANFSDTSTFNSQDIFTLGCALVIKGVQHVDKTIATTLTTTTAAVSKVRTEMSTVARIVNAVSQTVQRSTLHASLQIPN